MPRRLRVSTGGYVYHVLNRAVGRRRIFGKERDCEAFEEAIEQAKSRLPVRVLAWCVVHHLARHRGKSERPNDWAFIHPSRSRSSMQTATRTQMKDARSL